MQSLCQKDRYKESPVCHRVQGLRSAEGGFCFRGGWNRCRARGLYAVVVFAVACMAIAAASLSAKEKEKEQERKRESERGEREREKDRDPFVLSSTLCAQPRADWLVPRIGPRSRIETPQIIPPVRRRIRGEIGKERVGFPEETDYTRYKSRSHAEHTIVHRPYPFYLPRISLYRRLVPVFAPFLLQRRRVTMTAK